MKTAIKYKTDSPKTRFDARLTKDQKELFERAASLTGRTLTEFVISSAQKEADKLIEKHHAILISEKDQQIFFAAVMRPPKANTNLKRAVAIYKKSLKK
jgi:uncharacterized protein (DUF1778 family)